MLSLQERKYRKDLPSRARGKKDGFPLSPACACLRADTHRQAADRQE